MAIENSQNVSMRPRQLRDEDPVRRTATEVVSAALHPRNPVVELSCGKLIIEIFVYKYCGEGGRKSRKRRPIREIVIDYLSELFP